MTDSQPPRKSSNTRDAVVAASCGAFVALMVGMAYAAVPLYDWFCRTTGFNGTTQVSSAAPGNVLDRKITVRFDANIGAGLPWKFTPERNQIGARLGDVVTVDYIVTNQSARETHGIAGYNVAPLSLGGYFNKINCFCFTEQTMKPGETRSMSVVFYIDPSIDKDPDAQGDLTMTLSYTFYPQRDQPKPQAAVGTTGAGTKTE
jgi:cytochrome c oxidase assembly protein subunit 11